MMIGILKKKQSRAVFAAGHAILRCIRRSSVLRHRQICVIIKA
jgi:hypothetical protein